MKFAITLFKLVATKKVLLETTILHTSGRAWYNISAMVFSLNVDYIRSNRGMIVTAEAVSIFILLLSGFQSTSILINAITNATLQLWLITFISGISSDRWNYISCGWRGLPSILFLGNLLSIREFVTSQCSKIGRASCRERV